MTLAPRTSRAADSRIDVAIDEPGGLITPDLYGHFVEHLGGVVYDGVWVGERSSIPNTGGIRQALIDHMRRLPSGAIRWPGGCFADSYDWRDGVGPKPSRPRRTNIWVNDMQSLPDGAGKYETNQFGTNDFIRLCRLRAAAEARGRGDFSPLWAGQNTSGCQAVPAADLTRALTMRKRR